MAQTIWRWRVLVLSMIAVCAIAGFAIVQSLTPVFTATTQVAVGPRQTQVVNLVEVLSDLKGDAETISTEIGVIHSRNIAQKTVLQLGLETHPEFALRPLGLLQRARNALVGLFVAPDSPLLVKAPVESDDERLTRTVDIFLDRLKVNGDGKSRIITIAFQSQDPRLAAQAANTVADFYLVSQLDAKFDATRRANEWLSDRLAVLRQEVLASESIVEKFRRENGLIRGQTSTITTQEVSQVASDLTAARAKRIEAQSRMAQVQKAGVRGGSGGEWNTIPEVLQNPLIQKLREQEAEAERRAADLLQQFGDKHPRVIAVRGEMAEIRTKIAAEVAKIIDSLRNEAATQQAREASLSAALDRIKGEASRDNAAEVQMRDLERTAQANRTLYENFLQRFKETQNQEKFAQPDAVVLSTAPVPTAPSFPQKPVFVILSVLTGAILGCLLALIVESRDVGVRSMEQVADLFKLTPLGMVPAVKRSLRGQMTPDSEILDRPASAYSEAIRTLHTNLMLSDLDRLPKVVLITSSVPSEGKSTIAASLGQMIARYGQKVVLVDCDLRRPRLHRILDMNGAPGVADWLLQNRQLSEIIQSEHSSGLHLVPAGRLPSTPPNLLNSGRFRSMLHGLRNHYDLVILDSAPVLSIADTRVLASLADRVVFVTKWASTPRRVVSTSLEYLLSAGAEIAGIVVSQVNVKTHSKDGFSDSVLYAGPLKEYYR
jgi:exopolysaccharide transport family protein